jgi:antitoxin component YwqK of YwqJK toxin-antitoxin module
MRNSGSTRSIIFVLLIGFSRFNFMNLKIIFGIIFLGLSSIAFCQTDKSVNQTDSQGRKQGHWIKRYSDQTIQYDGYFKDDKPTGEFKRYYEDKTLKSVLTFSNNGRDASAILYHPNGNIASKGKYVNQKKEGKWQFFSAIIKDYLISEEVYAHNLRNGLSVKFYPDSTIAEKINYLNDVKQGEWTRYYPGGALLLKSNYVNGNLNGKFEAWFENGKIQFSGQYKNDSRDGLWLLYNPNGTVKYRISYTDGITDDRKLEIDASRYLDSLEINKGRIQDPEKTGILK